MGGSRQSGLQGRLQALRIAVFGFGLLVGSFSIMTSAQGQANSCARLQNQLSALDAGGGGSTARPSARYRQYDRAVKNQRNQIKKTQRMARRNGCSTRLFRQRNSSICGRILTSLDQMSGNLASLERERRRLAPRRTGSKGNERRSIIAAMNKRGCYGANVRQRSVNAQSRPRSLVEQIFGVRTFSNNGKRRKFERPNSLYTSRYNTYRTMCVRKKDGYYFPVSFSTTPERFERDERICQAKCQGSEVALYYHAMPAQDSEDMISFRGQSPYRDLPTAFSYRKKFDPEATCSYSAGIFEEIAGSAGERGTRDTVSIMSRIGTPNFRKDRSLDPETIANLEGGFDETLMAKILRRNSGNAPSPGVANNSGNKNIRVVGPTFFPVQ